MCTATSSRPLVHSQEKHAARKSLFLSLVQSIPDAPPNAETDDQELTKQRRSHRRGRRVRNHGDICRPGWPPWMSLAVELTTSANPSLSVGCGHISWRQIQADMNITFLLINFISWYSFQGLFREPSPAAGPRDALYEPQICPIRRILIPDWSSLLSSVKVVPHLTWHTHDRKGS